MIRELGVRRWIAWRLVQLATRIWDHETLQRIQIRNASGELVIEWESLANTYGHGVFSQHGRTEFGGYTAVIEEGAYPPGPYESWPDNWEPTWRPMWPA